MITKPISNDEAAAHLKTKPVLSAGAYYKLAPELKARAFTISGINSVDTMRSVRDILATLPQGRNWDDVKDDIAEKLREKWGENENAVQRRAELLLRKHGLDAYRVGQFEAAQRTKALMPYFKWIATNDQKTRPSHAALHGLVLPVDHQFWDDHMPPGWAWNCRCQVVQVSQLDYDEQVELERNIPPERRRALTEAQAQDLLRNERLQTGPDSAAIVRSDMESGSNPKNLKMSASEILRRYDAAEQAALLAELDAVELPEYESKYTARDWFENKPAPSFKEPQPRPLTDNIQIDSKTLAPSVKRGFDGAVESIWKAHGACEMPTCTLVSAPITNQGEYDPNTRTITINPLAKNPQLTIMHEAAHYLSHKGFGVRDKLSAGTDKKLSALMKTIDASSRVSVLKLKRDMGEADKDYNYLLQDEELFARVYTQYVVTKSGQAELLNNLDTDYYWPPKEFEGISNKLETLFKRLGWRL